MCMSTHNYKMMIFDRLVAGIDELHVHMRCVYAYVSKRMHACVLCTQLCVFCVYVK